MSKGIDRPSRMKHVYITIHEDSKETYPKAFIPKVHGHCYGNDDVEQQEHWKIISDRREKWRLGY